MANIIFRKNFEFKKDLFEEKIIKNFPFANEFYTAIKIEDEELPKEFVDALIKKNNLLEEYKKLNQEEKISAKEIILSILHLTPEFFYKEMEIILEKNFEKNLNKLKERRREILDKSIYLSLCEKNRYFSRISEGELLKLGEDFLINKEHLIIK